MTASRSEDPPTAVSGSAVLAGGQTCVTVGSGPPLVVLPGMSRTPESRAWPYRGLARVTRRSITVVNPPPGLRRGVTMREIAAVHAHALRAHFGSPVDVLGISTGGVMALQLAADSPGIVGRLIVATAASWLGEEGRIKLRRYGERVAGGRSGASVLASVLAPARWEWLMMPILWLAERRERTEDASNLLALIDAECSFDVRSRLGEIRSPTLLIAGGRDRAFPPELVRSTAAGISGATLVVYPRAGHLGAMMHPHFGRDVAAFLSRRGEAPAQRETT